MWLARGIAQDGPLGRHAQRIGGISASSTAPAGEESRKPRTAYILLYKHWETGDGTAAFCCHRCTATATTVCLSHASAWCLSSHLAVRGKPGDRDDGQADADEREARVALPVGRVHPPAPGGRPYVLGEVEVSSPSHGCSYCCLLCWSYVYQAVKT